jgi:hypothetical protein
MKLRWLSRGQDRGPTLDPEPWGNDDGELEYDPGAYEIAVLTDDQVTLAMPIPDLRARQIDVTGNSEAYAPGQLLMLGGAAWPTFEIVQVMEADQASASRFVVRRGALRTIGGAHSVGTPVAPVAVERSPATEDIDS